MLAAHGLLERVAADATRFSMLPYLLEQTDLIAIVPEYVGEVFTASHRVRLVRLPFETEPIRDRPVRTARVLAQPGAAVAGAVHGPGAGRAGEPGPAAADRRSLTGLPAACWSSVRISA